MINSKVDHFTCGVEHSQLALWPDDTDKMKKSCRVKSDSQGWAVWGMNSKLESLDGLGFVQEVNSLSVTGSTLLMFGPMFVSCPVGPVVQKLSRISL